MQDLEFLTIAEASKLIAGRKLSPVELTEAYLARIEANNNSGAQLQAVVTVNPRARDDAAAHDEYHRGIDRAHGGRLDDGVPDDRPAVPDQRQDQQEQTRRGRSVAPLHLQKSNMKNSDIVGTFGSHPYIVL